MRIVLIAVGITISLVAALADVIGYGDGVAFGRLQCAGTFGGYILALLVPWFRFYQRRREKRPLAVDGVVVQRRSDAGGDRRHAVPG